MPKTISKDTELELKISRSRFICYLHQIDGIEAVRNLISENARIHANATHNCYAYIIGKKQEIQYYSDAGEPGGTAGKPILNALLRADMTNVLAIVTRYYGGIKLGVKGLIEAYGGIVQQALADAEQIEFQVLRQILISCDYSLFEQVKYRLQTLGAQVQNAEYDQSIRFLSYVPDDSLDEIKKCLDSFTNSGKLDFEIAD